MTPSRLTRRHAALGIVVLLTLNVVWRTTRYAVNQPLWGDEAMVAVNLHGRDYAGLTRPLLYSQVAPPGFLWLSKAVAGVLGFGEAALRLWPYLAGTLATGLFAVLAWRLLRPREALLAAGLLAASYYPMRHSVELKPYSTDLLAAVGLLLLTHVAAMRPGVGRWGSLTLAAAVAAWLSFTAVLVAGGVGAWLLWRRHYVPAAVFGAVTLLSFGAMYALLADVREAETASYRAMTMWSDAFPPTNRPWLVPWWLLETHAGRMLSYPNGGANFGSVATLVLCVPGGWRLVRTRRGGVALLVLLPLAFGLLGAFAGKYPYGGSARTMQYAAPAVCLLSGVGLSWGLRRLFGNGRRPVIAAAAVLGVLIVAGIPREVAKPFREQHDVDIRNVVRGRAVGATPDDVWAFTRVAPADSGVPGEWQVERDWGAAQVHWYALHLFPGRLAFGPPDLVPHGRLLLWTHAVRPGVAVPDELLRPFGRLGEVREVVRVPWGREVEGVLHEVAVTPAAAR